MEGAPHDHLQTRRDADRHGPASRRTMVEARPRSAPPDDVYTLPTVRPAAAADRSAGSIDPRGHRSRALRCRHRAENRSEARLNQPPSRGMTARRPQPEARRLVLHGTRQLAPSRRHVSRKGTVPTLFVRRLRQASAAAGSWAGPGTSRQYLEARIDPPPFPAQVTAKVRFRKEGSEYRFDFTFADFSTEPSGPR